MGWSDLVNGDLIAAAETASFAVIITADKNLRYQQNLSARRLAFVVVANSAWSLVRSNVDAIARAVSLAQPGAFREVAFQRVELNGLITWRVSVSCNPKRNEPDAETTASTRMR